MRDNLFDNDDNDNNSKLKIIFFVSVILSLSASIIIFIFINRKNSVYRLLMYRITVSEGLMIWSLFIASIINLDGSFKFIGDNPFVKNILKPFTEINVTIWLKINYIFFFATSTYNQCLNNFLCLEMILILKNPIAQLKSRTKYYTFISLAISIFQITLFILVTSKKNYDDLFKFLSGCKWILLFNIIGEGIFVIVGTISVFYLLYTFCCGKLIIRNLKTKFVLRHTLYVIFYIVIEGVWSAFLILVFFQSEKILYRYGVIGKLLQGIIFLFLRWSESGSKCSETCSALSFHSQSRESSNEKKDENFNEKPINFFGENQPLSSIISCYMNMEFMCCILYGLSSIFEKNRQKKIRREYKKLQKNKTNTSMQTSVQDGSITFVEGNFEEKNDNNSEDNRFACADKKYKISKNDLKKKKTHDVKYQKYFDEQITVENFHIKIRTKKHTSGTSKDIDDKESCSINESSSFSVNSATNLSSFGEQYDAQIIEYCPRIFRLLKKKEEYIEEYFLKSLDPLKNKDNLKKMKESQGKSGSFFFFSHDNKLIIKTISSDELNFLKKGFISQYYNHIISHEDSLLARIFGIYSIKIRNVSEINIILMQNLNCFGNDYKYLERIFDLKGSTAERKTKNFESVPKSRALKDVDFLRLKKINVGICSFNKDSIEEILSNLKLDLEMLRDSNVMDYSILFYVINFPEEKDKEFNNILNLFGEPHFKSRIYKSKNRKYVYIIGLIDYLQKFNFKKFLENKYKHILFGSEVKNISAVDPTIYSERMLSFSKDHIFISSD